MNLADQVDAIPDGAELLGRARALVPVLAERAAQTERDRVVPKQSVAEMQAAGLFRVLQPKRWGGYELGLDVANDIQMTLAEGCMSTRLGLRGAGGRAVPHRGLRRSHGAGCVGQRSVDAHLRHVGRRTRQQGGPGRRRVSPHRPVALRQRLRSYRLDVPRRLPGDDPASGGAEWRMLLPRSDYEIVDTWNVSGLRAYRQPRHRRRRHVRSRASRDQADRSVHCCQGPGQTVNTGAALSHPLRSGLRDERLDAHARRACRACSTPISRMAASAIARGIGPTVQDPVAQLAVRREPR